MKRMKLIIAAILLGLTVSAQNISQMAPTPPMGWNSWDSYGMDITEEQFKATVDFMAKNLKKYGWEYVVLDMGWNFGDTVNTSNFKRLPNPDQCIDSYGRLIPNVNKFPSSAGGKGLKPIADYVHSKGLKFGLHILRGIPWQAVEQNTPIKNTSYTAKDIATDVGSCGWYYGLKSVDFTKPGAKEYYNSLFEMYAEWGVDYIKADDILKPYRTQDIEAITAAVQKAGRPMVLSLSAGPLPVENAPHLHKHANLWRISGDMWDDWSFIEKTFEYCRTWQDYRVTGHWPDCDMLALGKMRMNGTDGALARVLNLLNEETVDEFSRFTDDEKYTQMALWSIFKSPLMMGGDLLQLDKITSQLLTNKEVIAVNQNSTNNRELRATENEIVWVADDPETGGKYVALFNINDENARTIEVSWDELEISGEYKVRDLWAKKNTGKHREVFSAMVNPHGCGLYKLRGK